MIFTQETVQPQIAQLLDKYPDLSVSESNDCSILLHGTILIYRVINEFSLRRTYTMDIHVPLNSEELPFITDSGSAIDTSYHHLYTNGRLCLETDSKIRIRFIDGFSLVEWMDEYVEPYFISYEYYQLYGVFPNGERQHGINGIIESYQDLLHTKDLIETYQVMSYISRTFYRGHQPCPCGSNVRLRLCHGKWILPFYTDERIRNILVRDLKELERQLNEARRN